MKTMIRSFLAGFGSVLSIYPPAWIVASPSKDDMEEIGGDFARVEGDIARAANEWADSVGIQRVTARNGKTKEEQLELIPS